MTTINVTALDAAGQPIEGLLAVARYVPVPAHVASGELVARTTQRTDVTGVASFSLSPTPTDGHVVVTAGAGRWAITVPASGTYSVGDPTIAYGGTTGGGGGTLDPDYDDNEVAV